MIDIRDLLTTERCIYGTVLTPPLNVSPSQDGGTSIHDISASCDIYFEFLSLQFAGELPSDADRRAPQYGDGDVTLVQLAGQLRHLLPHSVHLAAVSLLGPLKLLAELQEEASEV